MEGLERLHFFNGQRLIARDLELEQRYHIRVRRLLNRGLYSPGVVSGLEVTQVDARHVRVSGGVALDPRGREIVLLADTTLVVPNRQPMSALPGYFLVIQYGEEKEPGVMDDCKESSGTTPPARIREAPTLAFTETWPNQANCGSPGHPSDCAVVLALVVLDASCHVSKIDSGVRQYAHSETPRNVHPVALEGEKDIDSENPKKLHFQVRGGIPESVLLSLWADAISSLYYTELGEHSHTLTKAGTNDVPMPNHVHDISAVGTDHPDPQTHHHLVSVLFNGLDDSNSPDQIVNAPLSAVSNATYRTGTPPYLAEDGDHTHKLDQTATGSPTGTPPGDHSHTLTGSTDVAGNSAPATGATPFQARGGPAYSYPDDIRVKLDGTDITGLITGKLGWAKLGDGTAAHPLTTNGTGAIDLLQLGLAVGVGPHLLEFRVVAGGGKVLYNLYVE
jgi:hypothetical protein